MTLRLEYEDSKTVKFLNIGSLWTKLWQRQSCKDNYDSDLSQADQLRPLKTRQRVTRPVNWPEWGQPPPTRQASSTWTCPTTRSICGQVRSNLTRPTPTSVTPSQQVWDTIAVFLFCHFNPKMTICQGRQYPWHWPCKKVNFLHRIRDVKLSQYTDSLSPPYQEILK